MIFNLIGIVLLLMIPIFNLWYLSQLMGKVWLNNVKNGGRTWTKA